MMLRNKTHGGCDSVCSDGSEWEAILPEIAFSLLEKLLDPIDHVRFASVCEQWSSIGKDYNRTTQRWRSKQALPMLMIPPSSSPAQSQGAVLYSVTGRTMYNNIRLPVPANEKYCGFGYGWFASVDESLTNITLRKFPADQNGALNVIHLPPLQDLTDRNNKTKSLPKVILSADPTLHPDTYAVLAIFCHSHKAAYIVGQQNHWNQISRSIHGYPKYVHAIFYRKYSGYLVTINAWGCTLMRFDTVDNDLQRVETQPQISLQSCTYVVESTNGNLFLVERVSARQEVSATSFKVSQVVPRTYTQSMFGNSDVIGNENVVEVNSIGDEAFFVCESHSMSVLASSIRGCQPNSIYYAYNSGSAWEIGIFSLENKTTTPLYTLNHCESDYMPFWITPSFKGLC